MEIREGNNGEHYRASLLKDLQTQSGGAPVLKACPRPSKLKLKPKQDPESFSNPTQDFQAGWLWASLGDAVASGTVWPVFRSHTSLQRGTDRLDPSFLHLPAVSCQGYQGILAHSARTLEAADPGKPRLWSLRQFLMTKWQLQVPSSSGTWLYPAGPLQLRDLAIQCLGPLPRSWWRPAQRGAVSSLPTHCPDTSQPPRRPGPSSDI